MKGYTLIEVIVSILLLAIVLIGGTSLFYQNLRSSGLSDVDLGLTSSLRSTLLAIERDIRFGRVVSVDSGDRLDCVAQGDSGYSGESLVISGLDGLLTTYMVENSRVASVAALTDRSVYLSGSEIVVQKLEFVWYCHGGVSDKMKISIDASSTVTGTGVQVVRSVSTEVDLLNSGTNL